MKLAALVALAALPFSLARTATAAERHVVFLAARATTIESWPEGERAVIAELATSNDEVVVRPSNAPAIDSLLGELEATASALDVAGAVCVVRRGQLGVAYVWLHGGSSVIRVEDDVRQGAVAEGAVALRVSELLRVRAFQLPEPAPPSPTPVVPSPPRPPARTPERAPTLLAWLGPGLLTSSTATPAAALSVGARVSLASIVAAEGSGTVSLGRLGVETSAGEAEADFQALALHAVVDPWAARSASLSLGLGGGVAWIAELARPRAGFVGNSDSTAVGLVSARIGGALRGENLALVAFIEPGVLVPAVTIQADGREVARLGRPWFMGAVGLGFTP